MNGWLDLEVDREHLDGLMRDAQRSQLVRELEAARKAQTVKHHNEAASKPMKREIEVRWGLSEDEPKIAELLELNGMPRQAAFEEQFVVAEENGEVLAAMRYRTAPKRLLLELLVVDPWAGEREWAVALYAKVRVLAQEMGVQEILAQPAGRADYPREAGYRRRAGEWRLDTALPSASTAQLRTGSRERLPGFLSVSAAALLKAFRA